MATFRQLIFLVRHDCDEIFQNAVLLSFYLEKKALEILQSTSFLDFTAKTVKFTFSVIIHQQQKYIGKMKMKRNDVL